MKNKPLFITLGVLFVLMVASIWMYLLLFGTPESPDEVYTNLGFDLSSQPTTITTPPAQNLDSEAATTRIDVNTIDRPLQQLTLRPVAGFTTIENGSSTIVRYAERGTGYIYDIDLTTGAETLVSQITIPQVAEAVFAQAGTMVALTSYTNYARNVFAADLTTTSTIRYTNLEPGAHSIAFSDTGEVLYAISQGGVTRGYTQNLSTETRSEVFLFDFINTDVVWGRGYDATYLTTRPAQNLPGYSYTITETTLTPILPPLTNAHTLITPNHTIVTFAADEGARSVAVTADQTEYILPITVIPNKCAADPSSANSLWCAAPVTVDSIDYLTAWNKGTIESDDYVWLLDVERTTASLIANPDRLSGRTLDVDLLTVSETGRYVLLRNRTDQTVWLLDSTSL